MKDHLENLLPLICNLFFFFLCSTKWNAGYNIALGLIVLIVLVARLKYKRKLVFFPRRFFIGYVLFVGGVLLASCLTGDRASIRVGQKLVIYSYPLWGLFFSLQLCPSILNATQWGIAGGTNVLNVVVISEIIKNRNLLRVHGPFRSPNHLAMVLESILPFLLVQTACLLCHTKRDSSRPQKLLYGVSLVTSLIAVAGLILSGSRGGIAGFVLGAVVVGSSLFLNRFRLSLAKRISVLALVFALSAGTIFGFTVTYINRTYDPERLLLLQSAYHMWQDHKWYGVGLARWNDVYRHHYILPGAKEPTLTLPHNNIANFFSGTGILGGCGFLFFMVGSLLYLIRLIRSQKNNLYAYAMLWTWVAISVHGMVDNTMFGRFNDRLFFAMWGVTLAASVCNIMGGPDPDGLLLERREGRNDQLQSLHH